ncbi:hypothetical protein I316_00264 [Kwoniella heveanensis BCC8398]|uniref:Uncharacterized protein n=1 Tax=Kwoniella heveanensis BCC8398 TaxID=1296120 RepID=A0A1B9H451_9TREE|nr:hypothetical protein I316_00264 [Kwoniella heveanensis BCC8398]
MRTVCYQPGPLFMPDLTEFSMGDEAGTSPESAARSDAIAATDAAPDAASAAEKSNNHHKVVYGKPATDTAATQKIDGVEKILAASAPAMGKVAA